MKKKATTKKRGPRVDPLDEDQLHPRTLDTVASLLLGIKMNVEELQKTDPNSADFFDLMGEVSESITAIYWAIEEEDDAIQEQEVIAKGTADTQKWPRNW